MRTFKYPGFRGMGWVWLTTSAAWAAPLEFAQSPAEAEYRSPAASGGPTVSGYAISDAIGGGKSHWSFASTYDPQAWSGYLYSDQWTQGGAQGSTPHPGWGVVEGRPSQTHRTTADQLDARPEVDTRVIVTHNGKRGVPFRWSVDGAAALDPLQRQQLQANAQRPDYGPQLLNFLRGDRRLESAELENGLRLRASRHGDVVHSQVWYVGKPASGEPEKSYRDFALAQRDRPEMIYVGANDGMLHGFSARTGVETLAYVPRGVVSNLHLLAERAYRHRYFVDGSPFTGDVNLGGTATQAQWRTLLVGALGAGGPGYFILDVTSPRPEDFSEGNADSLVVMDKTDGSDPDIGHVFAAPTLEEGNVRRSLQITRTNNQRWAVILGNGYNSANERPVLLIQYLDGDRELKKLTAGANATSIDSGNGNGLSAPQFLDVTGDGVPDFVYAGDLQGHLWKFDISAASDQRWGVAFHGAPLFSAQRGGKPQPITVAPTLRLHPEAGALMVAFGTGQALTEADRLDTAVQTVYSLMDYTRYQLLSEGEDRGKVVVDLTSKNLPERAASRTELMPQTVLGNSAAGLQGQGVSAARSFWALSDSAFTYCLRTPCGANEKKGWYLDLPVQRERVLQSMGFYGGGHILEVISRVPATNGQPGRAYRTLIHIAQGTSPRRRTMDTNGDGSYTTEDEPVARSTASEREMKFEFGSKQLRVGDDGQTDVLGSIPTVVLRPSWRHLK